MKRTDINLASELKLRLEVTKSAALLANQIISTATFFMPNGKVHVDILVPLNEASVVAVMPAVAHKAVESEALALIFITLITGITEQAESASVVDVKKKAEEMFIKYKDADVAAQKDSKHMILALAMCPGTAPISMFQEIALVDGRVTFVGEASVMNCYLREISHFKEYLDVKIGNVV